MKLKGGTMRFLTPLLIVFFSFAAFANNPKCDQLADPGRRAECYAHYGNGPINYPGGGYYPPQPPPHQPPYYPPPPPQYYPPNYGYGVTGPQRTIRWMDLGTNRVPKLLSETMSVHVGGRLVNEILIRAIDNRVGIESVTALLSNGQLVELRNFRSSIRGGSELRALVDPYYSLRIQRLDIRATSPNLIGSRGQFQLFLGTAE
jgi:hypothetical protein